MKKNYFEAWAIFWKKPDTIHNSPCEFLGNQCLSKDHQAYPFFASRNEAQKYLQDRKANGLDRCFKVVPVLIQPLPRI